MIEQTLSGWTLGAGRWWTDGNGQWSVVATLLTLDWVIRIVLMVRVILRRTPVSVTLAWMLVLLFAPVIGVLAYLILGERRLGSRRARRFEQLTAGMDSQALGLWLHRSEAWTGEDTHYNQVARFGTAVGGLPPLRGNSLSLIADSEDFIDRLIRDIDLAESHVHVLTYIWQPTGGGVRVAEALMRAVRRGVACRVLVDAVGSKRFLRSELAKRMHAAGVKVVPALHANPLRMLAHRIDLRNHRKIAVIDGRIAYTGSQNITDTTFRSTRRIKTGPWIDASVRVEGPAAQALAVVFLMDWQLDSEEDMTDIRPYIPDLGIPQEDESILQVLASGPGPLPEAIQQALLTIIYGSREELILTTPYFVPDDATRAALRAAAMRGVRVTIVMPEQLDAPIVAAAGRASYIELLEAGVRILHYRGGLLHAKTLTADRRIGLIGSANLDVRSFYLNFEVTLLVYDDEFASVMRFMQTSYMDKSEEVTLADWRKRPAWKHGVESVVKLLGPML